MKVIEAIRSQLRARSDTLDYSSFESHELYLFPHPTEKTYFYESLHLPRENYSDINTLILNRGIGEHFFYDAPNHVLTDAPDFLKQLPALREIIYTPFARRHEVTLHGSIILAFRVHNVKIRSDDAQISEQLDHSFMAFTASIIQSISNNPNVEVLYPQFCLATSEKMLLNKKIDDLTFDEIKELEKLSVLAKLLQDTLKQKLSDQFMTRESAIQKSIKKQQALIIAETSPKMDAEKKRYPIKSETTVKGLVQNILDRKFDVIKQLVRQDPWILNNDFATEYAQSAYVVRGRLHNELFSSRRDKSLAYVLCSTEYFFYEEHFPIIKYLLEQGMPALTPKELFEHPQGLTYALEQKRDAEHVAARLLMLGFTKAKPAKEFVIKALALDFDEARMAECAHLVELGANFVEKTYAPDVTARQVSSMQPS